MTPPILVPLDGSATSECALAPAAAVARASGSVLRLAHAPRTEASAAGEFGQGPLLRITPHSLEEAEAYLARTAARLRTDTGLRVGTTVLSHPVDEAVAAEAARSGAGLVVMATHGHTRWTRAWTGSVSNSVVRRSRAPVLLVRVVEGKAPAPTAMKRVLVPLDGSPFAARVLAPLDASLGALDAEWLLLRVVEAPHEATHADEAVMRAAAREATEYLERLAAEMRAAGRRVETRVLVGDRCGSTIAAEAERADVVAMATHARGVSRMITGCVTDDVLRASRANLLLFHPAPHETHA